MNKIVAVKSIENFKLLVTLSDQRWGIFDVSPYLEKGIFTQLKNKDYFNQVFLCAGGVAWPNGQDFSADTIALEMAAVKLEGYQQSLQTSNSISV